MNSVVQLLGTYRGRDKVIRLCAYVSTWVGGTGQTAFGKKLVTLATELGACRVILRLFDDLPMLQYTLSYGLGSKEPNWWLRLLELLSNAANQLYYPLEHVAWLCNKQIIHGNGAPWMSAGIFAWAASLTLEIIKSITRIILIARADAQLRKQNLLEAQEEREMTELSQTIREQIADLKQQRRECFLTILQCGSDLINAINWMPEGILWSGKLPRHRSGMFGTISTLIMLYKLLFPRQQKQKIS